MENNKIYYKRSPVISFVIFHYMSCNRLIVHPSF